MDSGRKNARFAGIFLITAAVAGILSVVFSKPLLDDPDYLIKIIENKNRVMAGSLLEFIMAAACVCIPIWLYPVLKRYNQALALGAVVFRLIEAVLFIVASIGLLSLLPLGQEYSQVGASAAAHLQTVGSLLLAARFWAGQVFAAIAFVLGASMYYVIFYQTKLIPRWLSVWGLIAVALHLAAVFLTLFAVINPFSAIQVTFALPILFQELVLALWLIIKGLK